MPLSRRSAIGLFAAAPAVAFFGLPASAAEPETFQVDGLAIRGYDPVEYFTSGGPVIGDASYATVYLGATWQFTSAANMATFGGNPVKYGARFGGYCAYAASKGYLAPSVPEAWTVYEGQLYLNFSLGVRVLWTLNIPGYIAKADANWPEILG